MNEKYLVKFQKWEQVSETDFSKYYVEKLFSEDATIKEIKEWVKSRNSRYYETHPFQLFEVTLSEPEQENQKRKITYYKP